MIGCRPLSDEEIAQMLPVFRNLRDRVLFLLGLKTGYRISELLSIKLEDLYHNGQVSNRVIVTRRNMKGRNTSRSVILSPAIKPIVEEYCQTLDGKSYLFPSRQGGDCAMSYKRAWRIFKDAIRDAQVDRQHTATHSMRKTFAKRIYEILEKDLLKTKEALGHRRIDSTISYLSFDRSEIDDAISKV